MQGSIRKSLSECVRNLRAREKRKLTEFSKEANSSCIEKEDTSSVSNLKMALIHSVDTEKLEYRILSYDYIVHIFYVYIFIFVVLISVIHKKQKKKKKAGKDDGRVENLN